MGTTNFTKVQANNIASFDGDLVAVDTAGGVFALAVPGSTDDIIITRVVIDVTTAATGACTLDIGVAANATTSDDKLLDGVDVGTAAGVFNSFTDGGVNGETILKATASQYLTASVATGASAGLVGKYHIEYIKA